MMADDLVISFDQPCVTVQDFARRYRVLAAMSESGTTFTMTPDALRAQARLFEQLAELQFVPVLIEVERPMPRPMGAILAFIAACWVGAALEPAAQAVVQLLGWGA